MRTIVIGDIHGCNQALLKLLDKVEQQSNDRVILLGDLFDRGPDSWGVFKTVKSLAEELEERFVLLRGNHEDFLLSSKLTLSQRIVWERVGRSATVKSFKAHNGRMEDAVPWLEKNCRLCWKGNGLQCVHAGIRIDPVEANGRNTLLHDHGTVMQNLYSGPLTVTGHIALEIPTYFPGDGKTTRMLEQGVWLPLPQAGVICIDTGSGKGGRLTAMIVEGNRYRLESVSERG